MGNIQQLFENFSIAYQHSLYAIEQEQRRIANKRLDARSQAKKVFDKERSKAVTIAVNNLMANMHKLNEAYQELSKEDTSILRAAEYLSFGNVHPKNIDRLIFSECTLPWIMPFLGHKSVCLESNGDACQILGLQFAIQALMQTVPGQLNVTVINPELRPEFFCLSRLPDFKNLTKQAEIVDEITSLTEEIIQNDILLQGRFSSIIGLRKATQQPVGKLRLLIIQDLPSDLSNELANTFLKIVRGATRAGISILYLNSKAAQKTDSFLIELRKQNNVLVFAQSGKDWVCRNADLDNMSFSFPVLTNEESGKIVSDIIEDSQNVSAITIPFNQIENVDKKWQESSTDRLVFNLGKAGLDTVSVCIGDSVSQHHNILISGAAGKGKSNLLEVMIHSLCTRYSPAELELYLLDFKDGLTFKPYSSSEDSSWLPHAKMLGLESDRDVGLSVLKDLEAERVRRAVLFGDSDGTVRGYGSYRHKFPEKKLPRIVLVIDEYQKLFDINDEISEEASALLENLVRQGRACAIHIILASQSITGTVGLLGKEERIYAQFPVRIALQNTLSESYSIFGLGNDEAAKLRVRGEAIINVNYGAIESNQKFTVAFAEPTEMRALRKTFCKDWNGNNYPIIFSKKDTADCAMFIPSIKQWRKAVVEGSAIRIPCGVNLSVKKDILPITFSNNIGRNIAVLGSGENLQIDGVLPGRKNTAIGIIQGFAVSLALQHPNGDARFVMIDGLASDVRKNSNISRWLRLMERFGFPVEVVDAKDAAEWLIAFQQEVMVENSEENTYILGFGMDRCSNFGEINLCGESGASAFQEILKYGTKGVHLICWWSNISTFNTHLGFGNDGYVGTKILLRMDTETARDVLGPFVNWSVRDNRAYIHDSSDLAADAVVMPLLPITDRVCGIIEAEDW